jgi:hypothetical protein
MRQPSPAQRPIVIVLALLTLGWLALGAHAVTRIAISGIETSNGEIDHVVPGSPAEAQGLLAGDRVLEVLGDDDPGLGRQMTYVVERDGEELRFELTAGPLPEPQRSLLLALRVMGLVYLLCGVGVFFLVGSRPALLFALYGVSTAVHWSGLLDLGSDRLRSLIIAVLLLSTMCAASFLLHFALLFPWPRPAAARGRTPWLLYLPIALALVIAAVTVASHPDHPLTGQAQIYFILLESLQAYLYSFLALYIFALRYARADARERRAHGLGVMLWGSLAGSLPYLLALVLEALSVPLPGGLGSDPFTLFFTLIPLAIGYAVLRSHGEPTPALAAA